MTNQTEGVIRNPNANVLNQVSAERRGEQERYISISFILKFLVPARIELQSNLFFIPTSILVLVFLLFLLLLLLGVAYHQEKNFIFRSDWDIQKHLQHR